MNKAYGPPATLKYHEPEFDIRLVIRGSHWEQTHITTVRGARVSPLGPASIDSRKIGYVRCVFPDYSVRLVNAGNIRTQKVKGSSWHVQQNS
jgi:hypothetical protein